MVNCTAAAKLFGRSHLAARMYYPGVLADTHIKVYSKTKNYPNLNDVNITSLRGTQGSDRADRSAGAFRSGSFTREGDKDHSWYSTVLQYRNIRYTFTA